MGMDSFLAWRTWGFSFLKLGTGEVYIGEEGLGWKMHGRW